MNQPHNSNQHPKPQEAAKETAVDPSYLLCRLNRVASECHRQLKSREPGPAEIDAAVCGYVGTVTTVKCTALVGAGSEGLTIEAGGLLSCVQRAEQVIVSERLPVVGSILPPPQGFPPPAAKA